jgi:hypothetical protein
MPKAVAHFWWLPTTVSVVLSALGIFALAHHAFVEWSLSAPVALVMAAYNNMMQFFFGWAHPYLQAALTWLGSFIGWRPTLYPHWRDAFVVLSLVGFGAARVAWRWGDRDNQLLSLSMILAAAVSALAAGLMPLQSPDLVIQLLIASSLGLVALVHTALQAAVDRYSEGLLIALILAVVTGAAATLMTWLLSLALGRVGGLGLAGMASVVVLVGLSLVIFNRHRTLPADWELFEWGITILGGFVGAAFLAAVNAGLKLLGA